MQHHCIFSGTTQTCLTARFALLLHPGPWPASPSCACLGIISCTLKEEPLAHQQCGNEMVGLVIQVAWEIRSYRVPSAKCSFLLPEKILPVQLDMTSMLAWKCYCWGGSACRRPCKASMRPLCWGFCWDTAVIAQWTFLIPPSRYSYRLSRDSKHFSPPEQLHAAGQGVLHVGGWMPPPNGGFWLVTHGDHTMSSATGTAVFLTAQPLCVLSDEQLFLCPQRCCFTDLAPL